MSSRLLRCLAAVLMISAPNWASASGPSRAELDRLATVIGAKAVACHPVGILRPSSSRTRGDEGFFKFKLAGSEVSIFDNGGEGFGFANGGFRDLHVGDEDLFMSVGDDGYQILTLHIDDFTAGGERCAEGRLMSYFDGYHGGGEAKGSSLKCCLE